MPHTLTAVAQLIKVCTKAGWPPPVLLVVPGQPWSRSDLAQLKAWESAGHELAGHGWFHQIDAYGGLFHRLHGALISQQVAEHLCLDTEQILALMQRCHAWFIDQALSPPRRYVPPAWALGDLPRYRLKEQPFLQIETLRGVYDLSNQRWQHRALLGYEARNSLQHNLLTISNAINRARARWTGLRVGLHPNDLNLTLSASLQSDLHRFSPLAPFH